MTPQPARRGSAAHPQQCAGDVCITCGDVAVPLRVSKLLGDGLAVVETRAGLEEISVALVDAEPGDLVLVHAKEAITVLEKSP